MGAMFRGTFLAQQARLKRQQATIQQLPSYLT